MYEKRHTKKKSSRESHGSLATWPESRMTREIQPIKNFSNSSMCFSHDLFRRLALASQSQNPHLHKIFTKFSHRTLTLNPTKIDGND